MIQGVFEEDEGGDVNVEDDDEGGWRWWGYFKNIWKLGP